MNIWIHYTTHTGSDDYSVKDWDAAKIEIIGIIKHGIGYVCDKEIESQIEALFETDWKQAVELYNKHNAVHEYIAYREGERAYG